MLSKNTDKNAWGPQLWHSIHMIALNYPDQPSPTDRLNYKLFFESLKDVIPCLTCADHYGKNMQDLPIERYLDDSGKLFEWTVALHNLVNSTYKKREWSVDEARAFYATYTPQVNCKREAAGEDAAAGPGGVSSRMERAKSSLIVSLMLLLSAVILLFIVFLVMRARHLLFNK